MNIDYIDMEAINEIKKTKDYLLEKEDELMSKYKIHKSDSDFNELNAFMGCAILQLEKLGLKKSAYNFEERRRIYALKHKIHKEDEEESKITEMLRENEEVIAAGGYMNDYIKANLSLIKKIV